MTMLAFFGLAISAQYQFHAGVWVSVPLIGYAYAPGFACMLCWMDEMFIPMSGNLTSYLIMTMTIGIGLNPLLTAYLIEKWTTMSFCYVLVVEGIVVVLLLAILSIAARKVIREYGKTYNTTTEVMIKLNHKPDCHLDSND